MLLQGLPDTEVKAVPHTLDRRSSGFIPLFRFGLLMLVLRQGLYISYSCSVGYPLYLLGLVTEQTAHSSQHFQRCIIGSNIGKPFFHNPNQKTRLNNGSRPRRVHKYRLGVDSKDLM